MRQILIMAIFLVQAFAASAQSNIEKVFKIVLNDAVQLRLQCRLCR